MEKVRKIRGEDSVFNDGDLDDSSDMLRKLLVRIFIDKKITFRDFTERHRKYMINKGYTNKQIVSNRNNMIKALTHKNNLTYKRFEAILKDILGLNLIELTCQFKDINNKPYSMSEKRMTF